MENEPRVFLVGAGPGDPDLLTLKAHRLLQSADVVVYDRLVSEGVLALVPAGVTRIYVGKRTGQHHLPQEQINALLVRLAQAGHRVVRLKGGDPFMFGRGSEEAVHLVRNGVGFEVVPGVTAAVAAAAYSGIPLTHRGLATGVRIVTGHCRNDEPLNLDWAGLANPDTTLAVYMGLANLQEFTDQLARAGLPLETPAAIIERGTLSEQRRVITTLSELASCARRHAVSAPAMVIIGRVVQMAGTLDWFSPRGIDAGDDREARAGG